MGRAGEKRSRVIFNTRTQAGVGCNEETRIQTENRARTRYASSEYTESSHVVFAVITSSKQQWPRRVWGGEPRWRRYYVGDTVVGFRNGRGANAPAVTARHDCIRRHAGQRRRPYVATLPRLLPLHPFPPPVTTGNRDCTTDP